MAVDTRQIQLTGFFQHRDQMRNIGMYVAVGQKAEEVQRVAGIGVVRQAEPRFRAEQRAVFDRLADELCALRIDLTAAERVMAHLTVAHVVVGRQTDCRAVRLEPGVGAGGK